MPIILSRFIDSKIGERENFVYFGLYKYLGVMLDQHNSFMQGAEDRLELATKAFWSMQKVLVCTPGDA